MTIEEAKKLDHFLCSDCVSEEDPKKAGNTFSASPMADGKVQCLSHFGVVISLFHSIHLLFECMIIILKCLMILCKNAFSVLSALASPCLAIVV